MAEARKNEAVSLSRTRRTLPIALLRAREQLMDRFRPMLLSHGVTEQQWRVLRVLNENAEMDATDLAEKACVLGPSLSRIIKALEARALIHVGKHPKDGRRAVIKLSHEGQQFVETVARESAAIYKTIEAKVGADRIGSVLNDLEELTAALQSPD
ncbi:homoprotocatechuate degradation operon regulator HpaR [Ruegeria marina]|uniref:Transcriptional regulator, MarR family n=1 Tax=Ruegeria marina TaxID=639004 RepID=A0A1G7DLU8_9RHOB|nr:homoprotocatechuate degradation operon regulator HpaR [Ruegeria marina]SDE52050.1 transcriptional regulator, MarR family [Ruegeria marina]